MDLTEKTAAVHDIYRGRIVYLHEDEVTLPDGSPARREIVEHSGGVAIVPLDDDGNVYCVRQYRYAVHEHLLELPAGKLNDGEEPLECAVRELGEETGLSARELIPLGAVYPSPGYCRETLYMYLARGLEHGQQHLDEGEFLDVEKYPLETLADMSLRGEIMDAKTVIAVLKTKLFIEGNGNNHA